MRASSGGRHRPPQPLDDLADHPHLFSIGLRQASGSGPSGNLPARPAHCLPSRQPGRRSQADGGRLPARTIYSPCRKAGQRCVSCAGRLPDGGRCRPIFRIPSARTAGDGPGPVPAHWPDCKGARCHSIRIRSGCRNRPGRQHIFDVLEGVAKHQVAGILQRLFLPVMLERMEPLQHRETGRNSSSPCSGRRLPA